MPRKKTLKFQAPTGMHDILPRDQKYFRRIHKAVKDVANFYRFGKVSTPILEDAELFSKGTGVTTDIVQKQMFTLRTRGGKKLALRPEGTPPIVRSYLENGMQALPQPVRIWYFGPYFRYERPQAGRYRQFWQMGFEIIGDSTPVVDAQIIQIFYAILKDIGFKNLVIEVNSIGDSQCRPYYKKLLVSYFRSKQSSLCTDCRRRLKENPLRILDCKEEKCQRIIKSAPQLIDHLCKECHDHFKEVLEFLDDLELPYHLNPYLVRGLDYYTRTVFEIFSTREESSDTEEISKTALAGGGRYDRLVKILGGKDTPAVGGAAGVERIIDLMRKEKVRTTKPKRPKLFLAQLGGKAKRVSLKLMEDFRRNKVFVVQALTKDSLKSQLKVADKLGVKYAFILGQKEVVEEEILIRNMKTGKQKTVKLDKVVREAKKLKD